MSQFYRPNELAEARMRRLICCALVFLAAGLVAPGVAWAAAPMCNEDAQSIEAPPSILPTRTAELNELSCTAELATTIAQTLPDSGSLTRVSVLSFDKSLALTSTAPRPDISPRLPVARSSERCERPGFPHALYRPPRL